MAAVQTFTLNTGSKIPAIGFGTWKSAPGEVAAAVEAAFEAGYRHFDCAPLYYNEAEIGEVFKRTKVPRSEYFVTTKLVAAVTISPASRLRPPISTLNKHTQDLIGGEQQALMKPGSRIVNIARGQVFNEAALIDALNSGHISAAALDVHYHEPQVPHELARMENVTLTTHIGGGALETRINFELNAMKNIIAVVGDDGSFKGERITPVNRKAFGATISK